MKTFLLVAAAVIGAHAPAVAQLRIETGGGEARLDQMQSSALTAFGGSLDAALGRTHLSFAGTSEQHTGLGVAGAMLASARLRFMPGGWQLDVGPVARAARGIGEQWAGTLAADVTATRTLRRLMLQAGWQEGIARSGSEGTRWRQPSVVAELRVGRLLIAPSWQSTIVQDSTLRSNFLFDSPIATPDSSLYQSRVRDIQDVALKLGWTEGPVTFNAQVGRRFGASIVPESWWEGRAAFRITPIVSLTMRTGHLASDVLLGLRGGQYTTIGLRLDLLQRGTSDQRLARTHGTRELAEVVRESPTMVHLYFTLPPGVRRAALSGDLTSWHALNLARTSDGRWEIVLPALAGTYRIDISADDGPWIAPPGLPASDDGFGSKVGLLVLEQ